MTRKEYLTILEVQFTIYSCANYWKVCKSNNSVLEGCRTKGHKWDGIGLNWKYPGGAMYRDDENITIMMKK